MKKNENLTALSQSLRSNATKEENTLWYQYLRRYPIQFRRQCVFNRYIVDFYCAKALLAVELDGSRHYEPEGMRKDEERTAYLNSLGIHVLRFSNQDIRENLRGVCGEIDHVVKLRMLKAEGIGRRSYTKKENRGGGNPSSAPCGGTFPRGGRF